MRFHTAAAAFVSAILLAGVNAQDASDEEPEVPKQTWSTPVYPPVDTNEIPQFQLDHWCNSQLAACPALCRDMGTEALHNDCWAESLDFVCQCEDNTTPDLDIYSQTIPYFKCMKQVELCRDGCSNDDCKSKCTEEQPCGAQDPPKMNVTETKDATATKTKSADDEKFTGGFGSDGGNGGDGDGEESAGVRVIGQAGLGLAIMGLGAAMTLFL